MPVYTEPGCGGLETPRRTHGDMPPVSPETKEPWKSVPERSVEATDILFMTRGSLRLPGR